MFNQSKTIGEFQQALLMSKLSLCAQDAGYSAQELAHINSCIKAFVQSLSEYDYGYVSHLSQHELDDLIMLIKEPQVLMFLVNQQLNLSWIFGYTLSLSDESDEIRDRMEKHNAPWGKSITLTLANFLVHPALTYFVNHGIVRFQDLRSWDKGYEMGTAFVYKVLTFITDNAAKLQMQLEDHTFNKATLHQYFLEQGNNSSFNLKSH